MRKFTQVREQLESQKYYKATVTIELVTMADNEGDAGYNFDSILKSVENSTDYTIQIIDEISAEDYKLDTE